MRNLTRGFTHFIGRIDAERFGRDQPLWRVTFRQFPSTTAISLGLKIPIGTVNSIACRPGLHGILKFLARHAA